MDDIPVIRATRIGNHALQYLTAQPGDGYQASEYSNGVTVLFEANSDPRFVSFQAALSPLHPWAVEMDLPPVFESGRAVHVVSDMVHFTSIFFTAIADAEVHELRLPTWTKEEARNAQKGISLAKTVLDLWLNQGILTPVQKQFEEELRRAHGESFEDFARRTIGLGTGSTPSGDDYLVGQLTVLWAVRMQSPRARHQLTGFHRLCQWDLLRARTPLPSAQMLMAASSGYVSESLLGFMSAISGESEDEITRTAVSLACQGATSGIEMLSGVLEALQTLDL